MGQIVRNPNTGQTFELVANQWQDITPTNAELAAEGSSPLEAFGVGTAITARQAAFSVAEFAAKIPFREEVISTERRQAFQAEMQVLSRDDDARLAAISERFPVSTFAGQAAAFAPGAALGAPAGASLRTIAALEGAIGATEGFFSRPGTIGERVQNAAIGGVAGAAGAGLIGGGATAIRNMFGRGRVTDNFGGQVDIELGRSPVDLQAETSVPRLGEAAQRQYDRLASTADYSSNPSAFKRELIARADEIGIAITAGGRTGDDNLRRLEATLGSTPGLSEPFDQLRRLNATGLNRQTQASVGIPEELITDDFGGAQLGIANDRLAEGFTQVGKDLGRIDFDQEIIDNLAAIDRRYKLGVGKTKPVRKFTKQLRRFAETEVDEAGEVTSLGGLDGAELMDARSALVAEVQRLATGRQGNAMKGTYEIIDQIDQLTRRSLEGREMPEIFNRYTDFRDEWRLLDAMESPNVINAEGDVSHFNLNRLLRRRYPVEYRRAGLSAKESGGRQDPAFDMVKILSAFPDIVGDSGTATRSFGQRLFDQPVKTLIQGTVGPTLGRATFAGTQSRTGSRLFTGGTEGLLQDPSRSAARLGTVAGVAAAANADR